MTSVFTQAELLLQNPAADEQEHSSLIESLDALLKETRASQNMEAANEAWRIKAALEVKRNYISTFSLLKAGKHYDAWCSLERCEITLSLIIENSDFDFQKKARTHFYDQYIRNWQSLFPYKIFLSPGFIVGYYTCSICNTKIRPRSRCIHKKKKLYGGEICFYEGHELDILEISIVTNPVQKYSVALVDYDYTVIDYVIERLDHPFDGWQPIKTTKSYPRSMFNAVSAEENCPCKKGDNKFGECCSKMQLIEIPHIEIVFAKQLSQEQSCEVFPY
jgi:hypothetical protein